MTLTRILLKLEVKNNSKVVDFFYTAPDLEQEYQKFELIYSKSKRNRLSRVSTPVVSKSEIENFLGQRKYQTYTIQTYLNDMATGGDTNIKTITHKDEKALSKNDKRQNMVPTHTEVGKACVADTKKQEVTKALDKSSSNAKGLTTIVENVHQKVVKEDETKKESIIPVKDTNSQKSLTADSFEASTEKDLPPKRTFKSVLMGGNRDQPAFIDTPPSFNNLLPKDSRIEFFSGNPAVESTEGVLHLYRENQVHSDSLPPSHMLCMICIPATVCLQDLLSFLKPVSQDLELIKIVKPSAPNEYMALLKFRSMDQAHEFYKAFNCTPFNSIESDICHLVFVAHVECAKSQEGAGKPFPNAVELPVCAVCLEKMDESIEGILTILCNHSFHAPCMAKCEDFTCPVCRYIQTPVPVAGNKCFQCSIHEDLWICLICGEVGCGRYTNGHAYNHFKDTVHTFAMQLGSNRVWDYVGENYVHRLVMNKMDGKVVEVDRGRRPDEGMMVMQDEKFESLSLEYTYLLTNQLESQREYFENKMNIIESAKEKELEELNRRLLEATESRGDGKDKHVLEKRCTLLNTKLAKLQSALEEEKEMNRCLRQNQQEWQAKVTQLEERLTSKEEESTDLRDQLRDVMFYMEAQNKLTSSNSDVTQEELRNSHVMLPSEQQTSSKHGKKSVRRKK